MELIELEELKRRIADHTKRLDDHDRRLADLAAQIGLLAKGWTRDEIVNSNTLGAQHLARKIGNLK